ncbi:MAG: organic solvent resistance ABC transporter ATP-binding protein [Blastocatellia bacterium]|nr:MAG: organic solvent resistance ABC transporter ATP-binding protein [Blastocatellia bacterium]
MQNSPVLEFRNVSISFDGTAVLSDVSFQLASEETLLLTGVSGSGKSVLLHLAIGLLRPDSGQIFVQGQEIENLDESTLLGIRGGSMGMVFQEDSLFSGLSVYDNVAYRLKEHGWDEQKIGTAVSEVLRFVGMDGEENKLPAELSGGMKRRVEIARSLVGWPSIMLFDEPTNSLDPIVAVQVLDLVIRARDLNKVSSIYVTKKLHELPYLAHYCAEQVSDGPVRVLEAGKDELPDSRVMVLESGKIYFDGSLDAFQTSNDPLIKELLTLDQHDHSDDPYYPDPWNKKRRPKEQIL